MFTQIRQHCCCFMVSSFCILSFAICLNNNNCNEEETIISFYEAHHKDKTTAFCLQFFLGMFGAGAFYIEDNSMGFLCLIFAFFSLMTLFNPAVICVWIMSHDAPSNGGWMWTDFIFFIFVFGPFSIFLILDICSLVKIYNL